MRKYGFEMLPKCDSYPTASLLSSPSPVTHLSLPNCCAPLPETIACNSPRNYYSTAYISVSSMTSTNSCKTSVSKRLERQTTTRTKFPLDYSKRSKATLHPHTLRPTLKTKGPLNHLSGHSSF